MGERPRRPAIQRVELKRKRLDRYRALAGEDATAAIRELAHDLRGLWVALLHEVAR